MNMSDDELLKATANARKAAHDAPLAKIGERHTGERHIIEHTSAWATRSHEWTVLANEVERRGLKQPEAS